MDVTLICDNMASIVMKNGWVQACFVGCDRVAANGDTANKIGTSGVAILAKYYGIPFYVHVYVVPFTDFRQAVDVIVGNIHPARIADFSVDNHYLPVVAVHGMVDIGKGDGVELDEFDAACLYRLQMMFFNGWLLDQLPNASNMARTSTPSFTFSASKSKRALAMESLRKLKYSR